MVLLVKENYCAGGFRWTTIDHIGNGYLTGRGIGVYNPAGEKISQINFPKAGQRISVLVKKKRYAFITASKAGVHLKMKVHGTP